MQFSMILSVRSRLTLSLLLTVGLTASVTVQGVLATNLNTTPLPRERETKDFQQSSELVPSVSRFHRRLDYREEEKAKQQESEDAQKHAVEDEQRTRQEQAQSQEKREDAAVIANNKGVSFGQQRRWTEAIAAHEQAAQLDPTNKQFRINLSGRPHRLWTGKADCRRPNGGSQSLSQSSVGGFRQRSYWQNAGRDNEAPEGRNPGNVDLRLDNGDPTEPAIGDLESAKVEYQAALQLEPSGQNLYQDGRHGSTLWSGKHRRQLVQASNR